MDGQPGSFEDQFRRMVVTNGASNNESAAPNHPTVRLPPASSYPAPQQSTPAFPAQNGYVQPPPPHARTFPQHPPQRSRPAPQHFQHSHQQQGPPAHHFGPPPGHHQNRGGFHGTPQPRMNHVPAGQRARHQQQVALDPNAFQRSGYGQPRGRGGAVQHHLFNPHQPQQQQGASYGHQHQRKINYLQTLATSEVGSVQMTQAERDEKNAFRQALQQVCNQVCDADPERLPRVSLECFGSFKSGFATAGSDMDLVIVVKDQSSTSSSLSLLEDDLPRALERQLLKLGYGARLLTKTRVPIIKVCEKPEESLLSKLRVEREKWDLLPNELKYPHLHQNDEDETGEEAADEHIPQAQEAHSAVNGDISANDIHSMPEPDASQTLYQNVQSKGTLDKPAVNGAESIGVDSVSSAPNGDPAKTERPRPKREDKQWVRERRAGPLDFPKSGVGIQSDINFFNPLGLHNTHLLYCYSLCDDRVQPMVLFVKAWAKRRKINSSYSGTLSSYGFVLMVLHYLVNIASPPVLPNLQTTGRVPGQQDPGVEIDGWHVNFWRNDGEILAMKQRGEINANREPLGSLLAGFFQYYSSQGGGAQFVWTQQTLSLRSQGGILTKEEKGWTKAVTEEGEGKKIQHRYLFCIEDPFELNHNVARTVTHNGIVAIRDEFRRARRILMAVGRGEMTHEGQLMDQLVEPEQVLSIAHEAPAEGWQPDLDGATDKPDTQPNPDRARPSPQSTTRASSKPSRKPSQTPTPPNKTAFDVKDSDAFPSLGSTTPGKQSKKRSPRSPHKRSPSNGEWSEISGDKAKAVLDEVKRKKDEAQAESTAMGAAEAVLVGDDDW